MTGRSIVPNYHVLQKRVNQGRLSKTYRDNVAHNAFLLAVSINHVSIKMEIIGTI
jgi:hypothetical protein